MILYPFKYLMTASVLVLSLAGPQYSLAQTDDEASNSKTEEVSTYFNLENKGLSPSDLAAFKNFIKESLNSPGHTIYETDQGLIDQNADHSRSRTAPFVDEDIPAYELIEQSMHLNHGQPTGSSHFKRYDVPS